MRLLAGNSACVVFGLRRAQGPNGAMIASKYSYLAGFEGTSNVYAGYLAGVPVSGTQAHSFIMSFEKEEDIAHSRTLKGVDLLDKCLKIREELGWIDTNLGELYAFISFAFAYPEGFSSLIDSYSTMNSGIKNYLVVALVLKEMGYDAKGVRLDSGDLAKLSQQCRAIIDEIGQKFGYDFSHMQIMASNDINEKTLKQLKEDNHKIDVFGIGTNLVTCQAQPALGMVYKVVEFQGTARMKFPEEIGKVTLPGAKSVLRIYDADRTAPAFDLICLESEVNKILSNDSELQYYTKKSLDSEQCSIKPSKIESITTTIFENGKRKQD